MDAYENELGWLNPEYCPKLDRIVVCLDMDEFRVQVEEFEDVDVGIWQQQYRPIVVATQSSKRLLSVNYAARRLGIKPANEEKRTLDDLIYEYGYAGLKVHYPKMRYGREDMFTPEKYMNNVYNALENYRQKLANPNSIIIEWAKMEEIYVDVTGLVRQRYGPWGRPPAESPVLALCHSFKNYPNWDAPRTVLEDKHGPLSGWMLEEKISDWDYCADVGKRLIHGGVIANAIVNDIKKDTGMKASAGVSHTKLLSRLACRMNKPQGTTILSFPGFVRLSSEIKIGRIHGYGQSLAEKLAERYFNDHGISLETFADVQKLSSGAIYDLQGVFLDVFPGIRQITAQQKAEKLVKNCHGNDNQVVQCSSFFKKTMEASASIPSALWTHIWAGLVHATCGQAKHILRCLCEDFADRIWYYKENRNLVPQDIVVTVFTDTDQNPLKGMFETNLCGWRYMYNFILNYLSNFSLSLEHHVKEVKITARYGQQPGDEISDDEY